MEDNYQMIRIAKLAAPSTISGWRKSGTHPAWVDKIYTMQRAIDEQQVIIREQVTTIRTLARMNHDRE